MGVLVELTERRCGVGQRELVGDQRFDGRRMTADEVGGGDELVQPAATGSEDVELLERQHSWMDRCRRPGQSDHDDAAAVTDRPDRRVEDLGAPGGVDDHLGVAW